MRKRFWRWMDTRVGNFHTWVHFRYIRTLTPAPLTQEEEFYAGAQWTPEEVERFRSRGPGVIYRGSAKAPRPAIMSERSRGPLGLD